MKIRRDIASIPERDAKRTWSAIVNLVTGSNSHDLEQLDNAAAILGDTIADEHPKTHPLVFQGSGPQLRIYLDYYQEALDRGTEIDPLSWNPTEDENWSVQVPAEIGDVQWMNDLFAKKADRFTAYDIAKGFGDVKAVKDDGDKAIDIDWTKVKA